MVRVKLVVTALAVTALAIAATRVAAQETNVSERTFLTFSSAVEMPGLTLQPGTYVFKLADTPSRNVVQVWDRDEKEILGQWLFVQAERPEVSSDTVVMFRETPEGSTPAVQYWYFPGERIGKEFIYPRDQAERIAARSGVGVRTESGVIEGGAIASTEREPAATASAERTEAAVSAPAEPAPQVAQTEPSPAPASEPRAVGTSGQANDQVARADELPQTASPLALSGLLGLLALAGAAALRTVRS